MTKFDFSLENVAFSFVILAVGMLESLAILVLASFNIALRDVVLILWNAVIGYAIFWNLRGNGLKW